jgi:hypothetical protein
MDIKLRPEVIDQAERELDDAKGLVEQQYRIVKRLKRLGSDTKDAILLLLNLLDLQKSREQRLSYMQLRRTDLRSRTFQINKLGMAFARHHDKSDQIGD